MIRIITKLNKRLNEAKNHPIAGSHPYIAMLRYVFFNILLSKRKENCIKWIEGLKLYLRKGDAGIIGNYYFKLADFDDSLFVLHFLRKDDVFIDVGANLGHFTLLATGLIGAKSYSFEPVPSTFQQLKRNISLNHLNNIILFHCCPKRFSSITNFIDFTGLKGYKNAFCDFDPSLSK